MMPTTGEIELFAKICMGNMMAGKLVLSSVFSHTNPYKIFDFIINAISPIVDITDEIRICPITNIESLFNSRFTVGAVGSRDS